MRELELPELAYWRARFEIEYDRVEQARTEAETNARRNASAAKSRR